MTLFELVVPGVPQPAGSKKAVPVWSPRRQTYATAENGRPIVAVMDDAKNSRAWKNLIKGLALTKWKRPPLDEPLALFVVFSMPRPQSHYRSRNGELYLRAEAPHHHTSKPDATKLVRAVEDALNGIVWKDDSRVAEQHVRKLYGEQPGCVIRVCRAEHEHGVDVVSVPNNL